jgi:hypothetical protein
MSALIHRLLCLVPVFVFPPCFAATAAEPPPVKVFILAGQSNMVGHGKVEEGRDPNSTAPKAPEVPGGLGSLRYLVNHDPAKYGALVDKDGKWIVRDDVWISSTGEGPEKGALTVGFGAGGWIGPEYGFGQVVGNKFEEPVLIIKTSWGGKDIAVDFRPPSAGMPTYDVGGKRQQDIKADPKLVGFYYRLMIDDVRKVLKNADTDFPKLAGRKFEIAGFGWHQGWNDGGNPEFIAEYESNLTHLINDLRKEFGKPMLPVVIANSGFGGNALKGGRLKIAEAQMAVADPAKHPEFKGNVASVDTRPFWRDASVSPSNFDYHWNHNGETHYLIGEAMGEAMVKLLKK